jgi:hypothetical protein
VTGDSNALIWVDIDGSSDASNGWLRGHGDLRGDGVSLPIVALTANASSEKQEPLKPEPTNSKLSQSSERTCTPCAVASSSQKMICCKYPSAMPLSRVCKL